MDILGLKPAGKSPAGRDTADPSTALSSGASSSLKTGLYNLHESLIFAGFNPLRSAALVDVNEIIYNRGIGTDGKDNGRSNFNIFVKVDGDALKVFFTNPDYSQKAVQLAKNQIHHLHTTDKFGSDWVEPIMKDIVTTASKKPDNAYFFVGHGHCGSIGDYNLLKNHWDDGFAEYVDIARKHIQYNTDVNASGFHNNFDLGLYRLRMQLELMAGIVSVPSLELTLCLNSRGDNGPHENLWFGSYTEAQKYHNKFLTNRRGNYPPYGPWAPYEELVAYNRKLIERGELAVGLAHPAASIGLAHPTAAPNISWLGRVSVGDWDLPELERHVREEVHGIAAFNLDISNGTMRFDNPSEKKYFKGLLEKWNTGKEFGYHALSMAWSQEMREKFGKFIYADHDMHHFPPIGYGYSIHGLGKMYNILDYTQGGKRDKKPSSLEVVALLQSPEAKDRLLTFIPYDNITGRLLASRDYYSSFWDGVNGNWESAKQVFKTIPQIGKEISNSWTEMIKRIKRLYN